MNENTNGKLMTSRELGVDLDDLRQWVKRGLCRPTSRTPEGGYLWSPEAAADVIRAARNAEIYRQNRLEAKAIREKRATAIDWVLDHTGRGVMVLPALK